MPFVRPPEHFSPARCRSAADKVTFGVVESDNLRVKGDRSRRRVTPFARKVTLIASKVTILQVLLQDRAPSAPSCGNNLAFAYRPGLVSRAGGFRLARHALCGQTREV